MNRTDFSSSDFSKLVHFDLKGAPPQITYFEKKISFFLAWIKSLLHCNMQVVEGMILPLLKQLGATGILLEYEDMFPYQGDLQVVCQPDAYSKEDIKRIQNLADENDLILIPLVQTFGHLEFLLKHTKYYEMREAERYPNSICPTHIKSKSVILQMISQVVDSHPLLKYLHFGADEVWHMGQCSLCKEKMKSQNWSKEQLFLEYMCRLVREFHQKQPDIKVIIWDDMMRETDTNILKKSGIGNLVEPMVWHYLPMEDFRLKTVLWEKYAEVFPNIWVASAFKGATEMTQLVTPPRYHVANQQAWLQTLQNVSGFFTKVCGIAITGWQRFDHFTVLCELFPVALPCLAACLQTINDGDLTEGGHKKISQILGFSNLIELDPFPRPQPVAPVPNFPGGNIYSSCLHLSNFITEHHILMHHPSIEGAFSSYHVMNNRVNTLHIDQFLPRARVLLLNMASLYHQLSTELSEMYYPSTVEEFLAININPFLEKLKKLVRDADQQVVLNCALPEKR